MPLPDMSNNLVLVGNGHSIAKSKSASSEDAFFVTEKGVGISDGVGGWRNYGIDCSLFSSSLMKESQRYISRACARDTFDFRFTQQELECHKQALETSI